MNEFLGTFPRKRSVALAAARLSSLCVVAVVHVVACTTNSDPGTDTNTNWVKECTVDADCADGTSCECQLCTVGCRSDAECRGLASDAVCKPAPSSCAGPSNICVAPQADLGDDDATADDDVPEASSDDDVPSDDVADDDIPSDAGAAPEVLFARASGSVFDADRRGRALTVGDDGSIYVTGGQGRTSADLSVDFPNFWLAGFSELEMAWEQIQVLEGGDQSHGLSLALSPDGILTTVSTIYDGSDSPRLRRFGTDGMSFADYTLPFGITRLATGPSGELIGAGSNLVEQRDGRPFTEIWVGKLEGEAVGWSQSLRGVDGSISNAWDLAVGADGVFVAGSRGTAADSNASDAWLGGALPNTGEFSWEAIPSAGGGNGRSVSVSVAPDGGVVVAGRGASPFVHRYASDGTSEWERTPAGTPTSVLALESGYALGSLVVDSDDDERVIARIEFFDWDGALVWWFEDSACEAVGDMAEDQGVLVALFDCNSGLGLFRIPVDQSALGGTNPGVPALRACADSAECETGHTCQSGTCAPDCTAIEECSSGQRCVTEQTDGGECPLLGPDEVGALGVCLPRCVTHAECGSFAPGLTCWNNTCVLAVPECETRCMSLVGGCAEGCEEIRGRGLEPDAECIAQDEALLGCHPVGRVSTSEDGCVKSASGVVYSAGGLQGALLRRNFGFTECSPEELEKWSNASLCE